MADFCNQCAGVDPGDLVGLSTADDTKAGLFPLVLCEGCGAIQVDHLGNCVSHVHNADGTFSEKSAPTEVALP